MHEKNGAGGRGNRLFGNDNYLSQLPRKVCEANAYLLRKKCGPGWFCAKKF
jgi:hypothetical protein